MCRTRQRSARWASSWRSAPVRRSGGPSVSNTTVPASGNAAPSLHRGRRPRVSESNRSRVGARITRMGREGSGPMPGNGGARSASSASAVARPCCGGHATAVTRPTSTAPGAGAAAGPGRGAAATRLGARRLLALLHQRQRLLALLAPGIELVRLEALLPCLLRPRLVAREPVGAAQLVMGLDQVRPELERLLQKVLSVLVHIPLQVHESQVEVGVQRRLPVVVEPDRLGQMLDRLPEDPLLETDVADVDARQRIRRLLHEHFLEGSQGVVVVLVQHLRPAEQRLSLGLAGRQLQRLLQRLDRARVVAERDEAPPLLDEGRGADVVGVHRGPRARELGSRRLRRRRGELLVALDQLADLFLQLAQLADERVDLLEEGDDLALHYLALGPAGRGVEPARDRVVLRPQGAHRGIDHQGLAVSLITPSMASFSLELSRRAVLSAMTVRPSFTTIPVMYSAASPFTMLGGAVTSLAATCSTSVTASTTTPSFPPSHSRMTVRVSSRWGAGAPSRLRRSTSGTAPP